MSAVAPVLMGLREYARHRRVSHTAVQRAIRDGRIRRRADGKIDASEADLEWVRNTDQARPRNSVTGDPHHRRRSDGMPIPMGTPEAEGAAAAGAGRDPLSTYADARALRERYQAALTKLEYEQQRSELIEAQEVERQAFELARATRDFLLAIPGRLGPLLAAETSADACTELLDQAIRRACEALSARRGDRIPEDQGDGFQLTPDPPGR